MSRNLAARLFSFCQESLSMSRRVTFWSFLFAGFFAGYVLGPSLIIYVGAMKVKR